MCLTDSVLQRYLGVWGALCDTRRGMRENALLDDLELELRTCDGCTYTCIVVYTPMNEGLIVSLPGETKTDTFLTLWNPTADGTN